MAKGNSSRHTRVAALLAAMSVADAFVVGNTKRIAAGSSRLAARLRAATDGFDEDAHAQRERLTRTFVEGDVGGIYDAYASSDDACAGEECDAESLEEEDGWAELRRMAWREDHQHAYALEKRDRDAARRAEEEGAEDDGVEAFRARLELRWDDCVTLRDIDAAEMIWDS